jgi:hypothetical protein
MDGHRILDAAPSSRAPLELFTKLAVHSVTFKGHRSIQTTQRYIDGDSDVHRRLVSLI